METIWEDAKKVTASRVPASDHIVEFKGSCPYFSNETCGRILTSVVVSFSSRFRPKINSPCEILLRGPKQPREFQMCSYAGRISNFSAKIDMPRSFRTLYIEQQQIELGGLK